MFPSKLQNVTATSHTFGGVAIGHSIRSILSPLIIYSRKNTPAAPIPVPIHIEVTSIYHINRSENLIISQ